MREIMALLGSSLLLATWTGAADARADEAPPAPAAAAPAPAEKPVITNRDDFKEPGRFGLIALVTDDGVAIGATRVGEHYEVSIGLDAGFAALGSSTGLNGADGDMGATLRGGPRIPLGHLNYFSLGAQFHLPLFGKENGVSTMGSYDVGPYLSLQRNFAGTPLMIVLYVLPYEFTHNVVNDGSGGSATLDVHHFFQGGGFGLAYLF